MDNEKKNINENSTDTSLVKGSAWMTAGSVFSRILGALYIIPWNAWMGGAAVAFMANALYAKGYNIYSEFLIISTAGIPGAISKQISHYNAINEYAAGNRLFKQGVKMMLVLGIIFASIMFFGANTITNIFADGNKNAIPVIQSLSLAILIIPILSISRGYFQGYSQMAPSAISQFVEQLARVAYMLIATYVIMQVNHGSYVTAVTQSTFAAFIGALAGIAVLGWYFFKQLPKLRKLSRNSNNTIEINNNKFIFEIIEQAVPFIVMDSGITFYQLFDQALFNKMMRRFTDYSTSTLDQLYSLFGFNANKLIMITISLAAAMAIAVIPLLASAHARNDLKEIKEQLNRVLQLFFFIMIPASIGMYGVAKPLWTTFYSYSNLGIMMLQFSSILAILLGLFTVLGAVLQGLYQNKTAIVELIVGFVVKIVIQFPMIGLFHEFGPLVSTFLGMLVSCLLMLRSLIKTYSLDMTLTLKRTGGIAISSLIMLVVVTIINSVAYLFVFDSDRIGAVILLVVEAAAGGLTYTYLVLKTQLADKILGYKLDKFRKILKIK